MRDVIASWRLLSARERYVIFGACFMIGLFGSAGVPPTHRAMADPEPIVVHIYRHHGPIITEAYAEPFVAFDPRNYHRQRPNGWRNPLIEQ